RLDSRSDGTHSPQRIRCEHKSLLTDSKLLNSSADISYCCSHYSEDHQAGLRRQA
ncbi:hypothetical protein M9458_035633, partial [Cirrhinus mrigala]